MPHILFKYIFKKILSGTFLLTGVIVFALWLTQSLRFLDMIVNRSVSLLGYFYLVGFLIPELIVLLFPICLFINIIYRYNQFSVHSELSVWKSCGLSNLQIAGPALFLTGLTIVFMFVTNVFVLPKTFSHFKNIEHQLKQQFSGAMIQEGKFNNFKNLTIYVKQRYRSGRLRGVHIYHKQKTPYTVMADEGWVEIKGDTIQLFLKNGMRQEIDEKTHELSVFSFKELHYDLTPLFKNQNGRTERAYEKSLGELFHTDDSMEEGMRAKNRATGHLRILQPFFAAVYAMIALAGIFTGKFRRRGRSGRLILAFLGAFIFHVIILVLLNLNRRFSFSIPMSYVWFFLVLTFAIWIFLKGQYVSRNIKR